MKAQDITCSATTSFAGNQIKILPRIELTNKIWDDEAIIFIHPPKTAGTNLVNLAEAISKEKNLVIKRAAVIRTEGSPNLFIQGSMGGLKRITENKADYNIKANNISIISGHMPVPEKDKEAELFGECNLSYIGLLREPIAREISLANFDFQRGYIKEADVEEYILNTAIDNPQTRLMAGQLAMEWRM